MSAEALEGEDVLARVHRFRQAARLAVEAPASLRDRCLALLEIADMARREPDPTIRTWAERAIWEESKAFLGMDDETLAIPPMSYEAAQRQMRAHGYVECPACRSRLATDVDLDRWSRMRRAEAERLDARKRAVQS